MTVAFAKRLNEKIMTHAISLEDHKKVQQEMTFAETSAKGSDAVSVATSACRGEYQPNYRPGADGPVDGPESWRGLRAPGIRRPTLTLHRPTGPQVSTKYAPNRTLLSPG
jgi:hypothetical protein